LPVKALITRSRDEHRIRSPGTFGSRRQSGKGIHVSKKIAIALGSLALAVSCWTFLSRAKRLGYIDSAIVSVRTLADAEKKYAEAHPEFGYTCSMSALPSDEFKIVDQLRNGTRNGYAFQSVDVRLKMAHARMPSTN
jgi:hypothetical protein